MINPGDEPSGSACAPKRPRSVWAVSLLLLAQFMFPAIAWAITFVVETPDKDAIDWAGRTAPVRFLDALFFTHLAYAAGTLVVMRGWRLIVLVFSVIVLPFSCLVNLAAYISVSGVYF